MESKAHISYLPERTYLDKTMTIAQAFKMFTDFYTDFDLERARNLLEDLDLTEDMKISKMSKGMQEKLQLILVMSRDADLYILDEPLGAIDVVARDVVIDAILESFEEGSSMIVVTHLISEIEKLFDDVCVLKDGKIALYKPPPSRPANPAPRCR